MNKISLYILLILIFLGLSKSFSPMERDSLYIENERVFPSFFPGAPITLILIDSFEKGLAIKTYYQRYSLVHAFRPPEEITARVSKEFWNKNLSNLGMSLFRRRERDMIESTTAEPPGALFLGDPSYGSWEYDNSGEKFWVFHRPYRHFPKILGWGKFRPSYTFYKQLMTNSAQGVIFYGPHNEFGTKGEVTRSWAKNYHGEKFNGQVDFLNHLKKFLRLPYFEKEETSIENNQEDEFHE